MSRLKIVVIGAGAFTQYCLEAYKEHIKDLEVVGIYDTNKENSTSLSNKFGITFVANSVAELLALPSDIAVILTPPNTHYLIAQQALKAKKNVLIEKPIAFSEDEARELYELARINKLQMTANFVLRFHPFHQEIQKFCKNHRYGRLKQISTTALLAKYPDNHWYWKKEISGGFFLNTFCHFIDLYDYITEEQPKELLSRGSIDSGYVITSIFPSGIIANLTANVRVTNEQEEVSTTYIFENAVIVTQGWLPDKMTILSAEGKKQVFDTLAKHDLYHKILSRVILELRERIANPDKKLIIDNLTLLNAVVEPLEASKNSNI